MAAMLTPADVAAEFNCSAETVRRLCKAGKLRAMRLGDSWRISPDAVAAYRDQHTSAGASPVVTASAPATSPASVGALPDLPADYVPVFPELWPGHTAASPAAGRSRSATKKKARSAVN